MNNPFDFNDAEQQRGDLIPKGTLCKLILAIRPGGEPSSGGWLTQSRSSDAIYLDCEFTILEGPFAKRKLWKNFTLAGGKVNEKGESTAANISRATLRAILESARNVMPADMSEPAMTKRLISGFEELDKLVFSAKIGIETGKNGFGDKNTIDTVITPDKPEYAAVMFGMSPAPTTQAPAATPSWAGNTSAPIQTPGTAAAPAWQQAAQQVHPAAVQPQNGGKPASNIPAWAK